MKVLAIAAIIFAAFFAVFAFAGAKAAALADEHAERLWREKFGD